MGCDSTRTGGGPMVTLLLFPPSSRGSLRIPDCRKFAVGSMLSFRFPFADWVVRPDGSVDFWSRRADRDRAFSFLWSGTTSRFDL